MSKSKGTKGHPRYHVLLGPPSGFRSLPQGRGWECGQSHLDSKSVLEASPPWVPSEKLNGQKTPLPGPILQSLPWASMATSLRRQQLQEVEGWTGRYPSATLYDFIFPRSCQLSGT